MSRFKRDMSMMLAGLALGAVLTGGAVAAGVTAEPAWSPIYVDGQQVQMTAYNIAGNNYVKLRDIGKAVGFNVYYQNGVQVDSGASYTGEAPAKAVSEPATLPAEAFRVSSVKGTELTVGDRASLLVNPSGTSVTAVSSNPAVISLEQVAGYWVAVAQGTGSAAVTVSGSTGQSATLNFTVKADTSDPAEIDLNANMEMRLEMVQLINQVRKENGLTELSINEALMNAAQGRNIIDYFEMPVCDLLPVLAEIDNPVGVSLAKQIIAYLGRMVEVGIGYLSLSRRTDTLSGGEVQRIKMVRNLGNSLSNITYIFDEPTAGLHPADADRIGRLLVELRDSHNNVLVVEHSRQMMALADHIIELGPLAGTRGGEIVYQGDLEGLRHADTITAQAIRQKIKINPAPLPWTEGFEIKDAHCHNLKHIDVVIPKGVLTAVTGVAGSGKSSLVCHEFVKRCPEAIVIDQKPIGTSIRSTPATYTGVMDEIRKLFAKENGVGAEWFSFNSKGACPVCKGKGEISYEMAFAEPVVVLCEECQGRRYNPTALSYTYHGKNIEEVMSLTIEQAMEFFTEEKVRRPLQSMMDVGLGYMTLGQPTSTLSGGEVQRVKLASELHKEGNIYILDEPTTGLHNRDIEKLLSLLRQLVAQHNTVVIVEHRLELIAQADWIIDMGPEGGSEGGEVLFCGTPDELIHCSASKTGNYLSKTVK